MVLKRLLLSIDASDALIVVGLVSLIGGIAALNKPVAAIVFGVICLLLWARKNMRGRFTWDG